MSRVRLKPHHMCVRGKEWESQPDKQNRKKIQAYYRGGVGKNQQKAFVSIVFLDHTSTFIISHGGRALSFRFPSAGTPVSEQKSGLANQPKILCQATSTPVPLVPTIFVPHLNDESREKWAQKRLTPLSPNTTHTHTLFRGWGSFRKNVQKGKVYRPRRRRVRTNRREAALVLFLVFFHATATTTTTTTTTRKKLCHIILTNRRQKKNSIRHYTLIFTLCVCKCVCVCVLVCSQRKRKMKFSFTFATPRMMMMWDAAGQDQKIRPPHHPSRCCVFFLVSGSRRCIIMSWATETRALLSPLSPPTQPTARWRWWWSFGVMIFFFCGEHTTSYKTHRNSLFVV